VDLVHAREEANRQQPAHHPSDDPGGAGLPFFNSVRSGNLPLYWRDHVIEPIRKIGAGTNTLKVSYWYSTVEDSPQTGDPTFVSASLRTSVARAWRDSSPSGVVSMLPFEGAHWRFEQPVSFVQFHLPFDMLGLVCGSLFDRELTYDQLRMPADVQDARLHGIMNSIRHAASLAEPSNLLLDSWALILAEALLRRLSSHGERQARGPFGKIPALGIARVIDCIESGIEQDLRLTSLADIAGMSVYHFARRFKETVGLSPHAYVLSRRIARSRAVLSRGESSLAQVALACGFSSQAHFTTAFRRSLGVTPGEYWRRVR